MGFCMPKIYVIDDDKDMLNVVKSLLLKKGYNVSTFLEWKTADEAMKTVEPQLILLDVFLSGIDGLDICRKLKNTSATKHIPILLFSAFPRIAETAIHEYGADDFIEKPFEVNDLIRKVHSVLAGNRQSV
jgi:DNA-binding response OmpR family regulator